MTISALARQIKAQSHRWWWEVLRHGLALRLVELS